MIKNIRLSRTLSISRMYWFLSNPPWGKRGGVRVIYSNSAAKETWLLTMYAKNERENITAHELKKIKEAING